MDGLFDPSDDSIARVVNLIGQNNPKIIERIDHNLNCQTSSSPDEAVHNYVVIGQLLNQFFIRISLLNKVS